MTPLETTATPSAASLDRSPELAQPRPSLLARLLESRLAEDQGRPAPSPAAMGLRADLRPRLPHAAGPAVVLFAQSRHVQSYPLLFMTLALANPN